MEVAKTPSDRAPLSAALMATKAMSASDAGATLPQAAEAADLIPRNAAGESVALCIAGWKERFSA